MIFIIVIIITMSVLKYVYLSGIDDRSSVDHVIHVRLLVEESVVIPHIPKRVMWQRSDVMGWRVNELVCDHWNVYVQVRGASSITSIQFTSVSAHNVYIHTVHIGVYLYTTPCVLLGANPQSSIIRALIRPFLWRDGQHTVCWIIQ